MKRWLSQLLALGTLVSGTAAQADVLDWWLTPDQQGQRAYDRGEFEEAAQHFRDPARIGAALYAAKDFEGAAARLRDFLLFRFGGVPRYIEERGHPRLRMRHVPFAIGEPERDRWLKLMEEAVRETEVPPAAAGPLMEFFAGVAEFMRNR
mgnify:CR=1 FL=1